MMDSESALRLSLPMRWMPAHKGLTKHQIIFDHGRAGKNLCVAPMTGAMALCLEECVDGRIASSESDRVAHAIYASLGQPAHFQPACVLSKEVFLRLQLRLLKRRMALLQLGNKQEEAHDMYLLCQQMCQKAKKSVVKEQAVSFQLRQQLIAAKHQLTQSSHYLAEHNEGHNQLKQQLGEETGQREELRRQLQGIQLELDQARLIIAEHQQVQQAQQRHNAHLQAQRTTFRAEVQDERHISAQLRSALDHVLEAHNEHSSTAQTQGDLETVSAELRAEQQQKDELQLQLNHLRGHFQAEQQHSTEESEQLSRARVELEVEQKVQAELEDTTTLADVKSKEAAAAASHSAAAAAQAQHEKEVASHTCTYTRFYADFEKELQQQSSNIDCLQKQLAQVQGDLAQASSALSDKTQTASALNIELEQLRQAELQKQQRSDVASTDGEVQDQLGSPATTQPGQDASSVLSKAATLHGMEALPSLAGLELNPGQGRVQTDGAVLDSPIAPSSPLIAAKTPFAQVSRPAQEQKQSPLGSPETATQKRQQTRPGQVGNAPDTVTHCTEWLGSSPPLAPKAAAEPSLSSTSVGVPATEFVTLAAATDGLAPQAHAVEGVHDALWQPEAVLAADDSSGAPATAEVGSMREDTTDQSAPTKAGMGQGESPRLLASPDSSQAAASSGPLPSKSKVSAEPALELYTSVGKTMSRAPEPQAEVCSKGAGLATSLGSRLADAEAKVMDRVAPTNTAAADMPPPPLPPKEGEALEVQLSNSTTALGLAEARPDQNATDCCSSHEAADTASNIQVHRVAAGKMQHSGRFAAAHQGCTFELGSSASVSAAAAEEAAEHQRCFHLPGSSASLSRAAAQEAEPMQGADIQPSSSGFVSTATHFGLTASSEMVRDTTNTAQSLESASLSGDCLDGDDAYEYPFCSQIRWLKDPADRRLGVGGTAQVFRAQLVSPDRQSVTDIAELEDKWYTLGLHYFYTAKLPAAAGASSREAEEECAFLVMGVFQGKDLEEVCSAINHEVHATPPGAQLNALMTWGFQFSLKTFYHLAEAMSDLHETRSHRDFKPVWRGAHMPCAQSYGIFP
ncbi:hypothetical protein WJX77_009580 [Trebouxia sp. C0004]